MQENCYFKKVVHENIGLLGSLNTQEQTGIRSAQVRMEGGGCDRCTHNPPQVPEVHFFIDQ